MRIADFRILKTQAVDKQSHLSSPEPGSRLNLADYGSCDQERRDVQIVVSDGLSAVAVHHNLPELMRVLEDAFAARRVTTGQPILVRYGRVKLAEQIAELVEASVVIYLIGERPGADVQAARSLSAYFVRPRPQKAAEKERIDVQSAPKYEYTVISNIHQGGLPPLGGRCPSSQRTS